MVATSDIANRLSPENPDDLVTAILGLEPGLAIPAGQLDYIERWVGEDEGVGLAVAVEKCLSSFEVDVRSCVRLLDVATQYGTTSGALALSSLFQDRFPDDEPLVERRLRLLLAHGVDEEVLAAATRALDRGVESVGLSFAIVTALHRSLTGEERVSSDLPRQALARFMDICETLPEKHFWLGRYCRLTQATIAALRHYQVYLGDGDEVKRYTTTATREAGDLAIASDRWGRDAMTLMGAWQGDTVFRRPWRADAARSMFAGGGPVAPRLASASIPGTKVYSHRYEAIAVPESAFDFLIDRIIPDRIPYTPQNRLLMIGSSLSGGGMERIYANTYRGVSSLGVFETVRMALSVFAPGETSAFYLDETGVGADEISLLRTPDTPAFPFSMLPEGLARRSWAAYQLILRDRPRVIHAWNDGTGLIGAFAGLLAGCPRILIHFHHTRAIGFSRDRWLVRSAPHCYRRLAERPEIDFLFVAEATADDYADWWCVERSAKFKRLYNGLLDLAAPAEKGGALRASIGIQADALVIGGVFRFDPVKKASVWIDAARLIHQAIPNTHFVLVGAGPELEAARAHAASLGLGNVVHFAGRVRNVADYFASFDLLMLASVVEGLPNCLVEAQLARVPVVSTNAGGSRETFIPGVTGRLVESERAEDLAEAAVSCLLDVGWRRRANALSREMALERFSIDRYLRSLIGFYGEAP